MSDGTLVVLFILFVAVLFIGGPILSILAVNHLFGTTIAINFGNWLATFWLHVIVTGAAARQAPS